MQKDAVGGANDSGGYKCKRCGIKNTHCMKLFINLGPKVNSIYTGRYCDDCMDIIIDSLKYTTRLSSYEIK